MKPRLIPALALATAIGSTLFIAMRADAQQQAAAPRVEQNLAQFRGPMARMSPEDRAALLDARIAAVKAGLKLTPDQEKMWPAVEGAVRDGANKMRALVEQTRSAPRPADPVERLRRMADVDTARGDALHKVVDAAQPLYASLTDDQKRRLPILMHGPRGPREAMGECLRHWWNGDSGERRDRRDGDGAPPRDRRSQPDAGNPERL